MWENGTFHLECEEEKTWTLHSVPFSIRSFFPSFSTGFGATGAFDVLIPAQAIDITTIFGMIANPPSHYPLSGDQGITLSETGLDRCKGD